MRFGASCALRMCRSCRLSIQYRPVLAPIPSTFRSYARSRGSTDAVAQKDQVEALIRGEIPAFKPSADQKSSRKSAPKSRGKKRKDGPGRGRSRGSTDGVAQKDQVEALIRGDAPSSKSPAEQKPNHTEGLKKEHWQVGIGAQDRHRHQARHERILRPQNSRDTAHSNRDDREYPKAREGMTSRSDPFARLQGNMGGAPNMHQATPLETEDLMKLLDDMRNDGKSRTTTTTAQEHASKRAEYQDKTDSTVSEDKQATPMTTEELMKRLDGMRSDEQSSSETSTAQMGLPRRADYQHEADSTESPSKPRENLADEATAPRPHTTVLNTADSATLEPSSEALLHTKVMVDASVHPMAAETNALPSQTDSEAAEPELIVSAEPGDGLARLYHDETSQGELKGEEPGAESEGSEPVYAGWVGLNEQQQEYQDDYGSNAPNDEDPADPRARHTRRKHKSGFSDKLLYQKEVGIAALGHKVDALILRDPNKMRNSRIDEPIIERDQPSIPFDLRNVLNQPQESEASDLEAEVFRNIDELRPTDTTVLRTAQFEELQQALQAGFTIKQLQRYFQAHPKAVEENIAPHDWILGQFDFLGSVNVQRLQDLPRMKIKMATSIMLRSWHLETQDDYEMLGRKRFILRDDAWWLLSQPGSSLAKVIRHDFLSLSPKESFVLEEKEGQKALILQTSRATVSAILTRIDDAVRSLGSSIISTEDLQGPLAASWSAEELQALGNYTQTLIQKEPASSAIMVSWVPTADRPPLSDEAPADTNRLESPADVVYRLMARKAFPDWNLELDGSRKQPDLRPYERGLRSLSVAHRIRSRWARLASTREPRKEADLLESSTPWPRDHAISWINGQSTEEKVIATFGHILWQTRGLSQRQQRDQHDPKGLLLPTVPHPDALVNLVESKGGKSEDIVKDTAIVLNFEPHPSRAGHAKAFNVRLYMPVDSEADLRRFEIPSTARLELMAEDVRPFAFPNTAVDARLQAQHLLSLDMEEPIRNFMAASVFNLAEGRLHTPSNTSFTVPYISGDGKATDLFDNTTGEPTVKPQTLPYLFVGLEVHQSVEMPWNDMTLRYNSIEAGLHGGQRQELSLVADVPSETEGQARRAVYEKVTRAMAEIAQEGKFSWPEEEAHKQAH